MAKENETIADIIAEMRSDANADEYTPDGILGQKLNYIADRFEAARKRMDWTHKKELETRDAAIQTEVAALEAERDAHRREIDGLKKQLGNAAKLREALEAVRDAHFVREENGEDCEGFYVEADDGTGRPLICVVEDALAATPRNCDRFANAVEAMAEMKRVHSYCAKENRRCLEDCPDCGKEWCSLAWLFTPATESGAAK